MALMGCYGEAEHRFASAFSQLISANSVISPKLSGLLFAFLCLYKKKRKKRKTLAISNFRHWRESVVKKELSMEMDLFVTPEKQRNHPSVSLGKTPVRRKLIVDDDNEIGSEKKGQSRTAGGGLRQFSVMVCQKLEAKKITTYKEVADEIISDFATIKQNSEKPLNDNEYNEKNIRRRVYDALNVFMALDIIARDKKEIRWKGLPITCKKDVEEVKMDRNKIMNSVQKKAAFLKELREKVSSLENLMSRNQEMVVKTEGPAEGFTLPFILFETNPHAVVEIEISEDMQLVHLDFNSTPFSVHDDAYILKLMQEHKLQQNRVSSSSSTHHQSQHSSAHSSSSSCIASGTSGPVCWNSGSIDTR